MFINLLLQKTYANCYYNIKLVTYVLILCKDYLSLYMSKYHFDMLICINIALSFRRRMLNVYDYEYIFSIYQLAKLDSKKMTVFPSLFLKFIYLPFVLEEPTTPIIILISVKIYRLSFLDRQFAALLPLFFCEIGCFFIVCYYYFYICLVLFSFAEGSLFLFSAMFCQ